VQRGLGLACVCFLLGGSDSESLSGRGFARVGGYLRGRLPVLLEENGRGWGRIVGGGEQDGNIE